MGARGSARDWRAGHGVWEAQSPTHSLTLPNARAQALRMATAALPECLDPVLSEARLWTGVPATFLLSVLTNGAVAPGAPQSTAQQGMCAQCQRLRYAGLDERFSSQNAGTAFGAGTYAAEDSAKADQYCKADAGASLRAPSADCCSASVNRWLRRGGQV